MSKSRSCKGRSMRIVVSTADAEIIVSQPGLGPILGARVLAEFRDDPEGYSDARARKNYAGTTPDHPRFGQKEDHDCPATTKRPHGCIASSRLPLDV
jgi:hypothetical protein